MASILVEAGELVTEGLGESLESGEILKDPTGTLKNIGVSILKGGLTLGGGILGGYLAEKNEQPNPPVEPVSQNLVTTIPADNGPIPNPSAPPILTTPVDTSNSDFNAYNVPRTFGNMVPIPF